MKVKGRLYEENTPLKLGIFSLQVDSDGELLSVESGKSSTAIRSGGYDILIKNVAAPTSRLPVGMRVDTIKAWLLYITKRNTTNEQLTISFKLLHKTSVIQSGADTGQWLTAVEFENGAQQVHIGTQDEEWFAWYCEQAGMPKRLIATLNKNELLITAIEDDGLKTKLPELFVNERFYVHYVLAESPRLKSAEYPDDWDVSTWYAVDQSQKSLEEAWSRQVEA